MQKKIIVEIVFNSLGLTEDRLKKEWIDHRMSLFMKYPAKSLMKQTNQNFTALVRYDNRTEAFIKDALNQYEELPQNIKFVNTKEHIHYLRESCQEHDYLYIARLDSDDVFHKSYIQLIEDYKPKMETEVLINQHGYLFDSKTNRLATYFHKSPQFYVYIYRSKDFLEGKRYKPGGHGNVIKNLVYELLPGRNYINIIHKQNVSNKLLGNSTVSNEWVKIGRVLTNQEEILKILNQFM